MSTVSFACIHGLCLSQLVGSVEILQALLDSFFHSLLSLSYPDPRVEILLVWLILTFRVSDRLQQVVLLAQDVISNTGQISILQIRVKIDLDDTVANSVSILLLAGAGAAVEHEEDRLVFFYVVLLLDVCLMLAEEFRVKLDITRLVDAMDVAKASSDAEVRRDLGEGGPDVVDVFGLRIERVVVDVLVVDTILFATSNANFLSHRVNSEIEG